MRTSSVASVLSLAIALAGGSLFAQVGGTQSPQVGAPSSINGGNANTPAPSSAIPPRDINAPGANGAAAAGSTASPMAGMSTQRQQIEGQLVDLVSLTQQPAAASASGTRVNEAPGLRIESGNASARPAPAAAAGSGDTTSADGKSYNPAANPNTSVTAHVGDSAGTYNRPGVAGGSSDTSAAIAGSGRLDPGDRLNGSTPGSANASVPANFKMPSPDSIRAQLNAGIPAAILSNGQAYVLACDPKQFAQFAGQTVRINGTITGRNFLTPDRLEVRQAAGTFQEFPLAKPTDMMAPRTGTAQDR